MNFIKRIVFYHEINMFMDFLEFLGIFYKIKIIENIFLIYK